MGKVASFRNGNITQYADTAALKAAPAATAPLGFDNTSRDVVQLVTGDKYSWHEGDTTAENLPYFLEQASDMTGRWWLDTILNRIFTTIADANLVVAAGDKVEWDEAVAGAAVGDLVVSTTDLPVGVSVEGSVEVAGTVKLVFTNASNVDATINPFDFTVIQFK